MLHIGEKFLRWIRQKFCKHGYRKHWSRKYGPYGGYILRCTKCEKEKER